MKNSHVYQSEDAELINYDIYNLCGINFRGPAPDFGKTYFSFIGAAQTLGRYCHEPFPKMVCDYYGQGCLNLGYGGADPSFF